jgi:hypothetical protein
MWRLPLDKSSCGPIRDEVDRVVADAQRHIRENRTALTQPADRAFVDPDTLYRNRGLYRRRYLQTSASNKRSKCSSRTGLHREHQARRHVGPGLDFTDKRTGDFYPHATIQPFAVVDSLLRRHRGAGDLQ